MVWFDPLNAMELDRASEETIVKYSKSLNEKHWLTYARLAWDIAPAFALYLPHRCDSSRARNHSLLESSWLLTKFRGFALFLASSF